MNLIEVLQTFAGEVPDFVSCSVVSIEDGTNVGSIAVRADIDPDAADAYFTDMLRRHQAALDALGVEDLTEDVLTTTDHAYFLTRILPGVPYFWNVVSGVGGSLGLTRAVMRKYEGALVEALP